MISLEYEASNTQLSSLISSFYLFEYRGEPTSELERADRAQFRFYLRGKGEYRFANGHVDPSYSVTIVGPTTGPRKTWSDGDVKIFGWGITPAGWASLMGAKAERWVDRAFDARAIFGESILHLHKQLIFCASLRQHVELAQKAAPQIYINADSALFKFTAKVDAWLISNLDPAIEDLAVSTALSVRQLERTTKRFYGMPPKKLARKYRALRAAHMLANGDSLDEGGLALAFYDQSHLIREIKQFTGLTPSQLKAGASKLTDATMRGRDGLSGKVSRLISES
jgi:AraC-like DNA-binding protein